jgi:glutaredoxin 3
VEYDTYVLDSAERRQEMIERASGRTTVPQIFIDGRHVGGCDDLYALDREGKLEQLLKAA